VSRGWPVDMPSDSDQTSSLRSMIPMLTSVILFSINTLMIRSVSLRFPAADGWVASLFRGMVGLVVVFMLHGRGRGLQVNRMFANQLVVLRGLVGGFTIIIFYVTIEKLGAARAVILNLTYPVFASVIAALWLKEKLSRAAMIWMLVGFCGLVIFLSGNGHLSHSPGYDLLAVAGAVAAGWVVVIIRRLRNEEHPATIYASQALFSLLIASGAGVKLPQLAMGAWVGLGVAAVVVAVAQLEMTRAYQNLSVVKGSSIQMLLPVVTGIGGYFILGETFHPLEILGAIIALVATWRVVVTR